MASRVQTAVTMRQVTGSMAGVVRGMEGAMKAMDLEKVRTECSNHHLDSRSHVWHRFLRSWTSLKPNSKT